MASGPTLLNAISRRPAIMSNDSLKISISRNRYLGQGCGRARWLMHHRQCARAAGTLRSMVVVKAICAYRCGNIRADIEIRFIEIGTVSRLRYATCKRKSARNCQILLERFLEKKLSPSNGCENYRIARVSGSFGIVLTSRNMPLLHINFELIEPFFYSRLFKISFFFMILIIIIIFLVGVLETRMVSILSSADIVFAIEASIDFQLICSSNTRKCSLAKATRSLFY